jgi:protein-S-isoprenylcysteine O-methyltransferase Ste14
MSSDLPPSSDATTERRALPMRLWLATPDWVFRMLGAGFFFSYLLYKAQKYWQIDFWQLGPYIHFSQDGPIYHMPWVPVLVDLTFVLIALGFCLRLRPSHRADNGWIVSFTLFTAFAPLIPIELPAVLGLLNETWQSAYNSFLWPESISLTRIVFATSLITVGNLIDLWGYTVLTRSFGIVPEARELKTSGPYRFVRHPVYLGQFISQGGVWLCAVRLHWVWIGMYVVFVAMQLYRSKLEDRVLAEAFGDPCREWQRRTFWFV